jgi:deoxycytidylate deaminase
MTPNSDLRKILKYITFMKITEKVGNLSYDIKHQVGSIIVNKDFSNVCAVGYNGNYPGGPNERDSMETGQSGFLHAEENALYGNNMIYGEEYIMFVTMTPCNMCAKRIARKHRNIKEVIALDYYGKADASYDILNNADIRYYYLNTKIFRLYTNTQLFKELVNIINSTEQDAMKDVLLNLLYKQLNEFFEFNKQPLENIPLISIDFDTEDTAVITKAYFDAFYKSLYAIL